MGLHIRTIRCRRQKGRPDQTTACFFHRRTSCITGLRNKACTWLGEIALCSFLTRLSGPAWVLLGYVLRTSFPSPVIQRAAKDSPRWIIFPQIFVELLHRRASRSGRAPVQNDHRRRRPTAQNWQWAPSVMDASRVRRRRTCAAAVHTLARMLGRFCRSRSLARSLGCISLD